MVVPVVKVVDAVAVVAENRWRLKGGQVPTQGPLELKADLVARPDPAPRADLVPKVPPVRRATARKENRVLKGPAVAVLEARVVVPAGRAVAQP